MFWLLLISFWLKQTGTLGWAQCWIKVPWCVLRLVLLASNSLHNLTSKFKINYAYVITQGICNNFIEVNFCVGCMVSEPNHLLQCSTTMSLINKICCNLIFVIFLSYCFPNNKLVLVWENHESAMWVMAWWWKQRLQKTCTRTTIDIIFSIRLVNKRHGSRTL